MFLLGVLPDHCRNGCSFYQKLVKRLHISSFTCLLSISLFFVFNISSIAQISVHFVSSGKKISVETLVHDDQELLSISSFAEVLNYSCHWDRFLQCLICEKNGDTISFFQDNSFLVRNGVTGRLSQAPLRSGAQLFLTMTDMIEAFKPESGELRWDASSRLVQLIESGYSIKSVFCEKKQNGTLLGIDLGDSLLFDITYFYPNLTVNFFKGTVDTQKIRNNEPCGVIKSVSAVQFKESAQISVLLNTRIEEPVYDYVQDTKRLMLSLRPETKMNNGAVFKPSNTLQVESLKTVVIDPGHGGKDPGAIGVGGVKEKDVVLSIALKLRDMLKKNDGITVHLTREKDVFVPLQDRTKFANDKQADLFISIHADAISGSAQRKKITRGYKVYFLSHAKNEEDKLVAMRENAVIELEDRPQNYNNLQTLLIDLAGNEYLKESQELCILIDQKFDAGLKNKIPKLHLGVGQANFWVLNGAYMPSVLIEVGFLSNATEEKLLADKAFQKNIASSIYDAIIKFKMGYEGGL
jgi:N-acetylmuramoyl-L-alanine amidase